MSRTCATLQLVSLYIEINENMKTAKIYSLVKDMFFLVCDFLLEFLFVTLK